MRVGFSTLLLWSASLVSFAFSTMAAQCEAEFLTFAVAGFALALGALGAGVFSDRVGRLRTVRVLFATGTIVSGVAAVLAPSDVTVLLVLTALAGTAAGGSHVSAEFFLEAVPAQSRALALLCFPVLFLPAGAVQAGLRWLGWTGSALLTAFLCAAAGLVLRGFPDASLQRGEGRLDRSRIEDTQKINWQRECGERGLSPIRDRRTSISRGESAHFVVRSEEEDAEDALGSAGANPNTSVARAVALEDAVHLRLVRSPIFTRLVSVTSVLWFIFIVVYWLSASALESMAGGDGSNSIHNYDGGGGNSVASFCGHVDVSKTSVAAAAVSKAAELAASVVANVVVVAKNKNCLGAGGADGSSTLTGSAHLLLAEVLAIVCVAGLANSPYFGRKWTLAMTFGSAAVLSAVASSVSFSAPSCTDAVGTGALVLEFLLRAAVASAGQALFLYTLEATATTQRSTAAGIALGAFRLGALLSLAGDSSTNGHGEPAGRLQWSIYALRTEASFFGFARGSAGHTTAITAALAACAQACLIAAALCACLPVDTQLKQLREGAYDAFTDLTPGGGGFGQHNEDGSPPFSDEATGSGRRSRNFAPASRGVLWEPESLNSPLRLWEGRGGGGAGGRAASSWQRLRRHDRR